MKQVKGFWHVKAFWLVLTAVFIVSVSSCGKKTGENTDNPTDKKGEFGWKDNLTAADIPDTPVKGMINGKEVTFAYINFEKWRGASPDNVLNFSVTKPEQNCGFIENFTGFTLINKSSAINQGEMLKAKFADDPKTYTAFFKQGEQKSTAQWNCALFIESITDKTAKGKIALYFNDDKKSWVAGKFEAVVCNN